MHILIAPNAFKKSLNATAVAEAIKRGLEESALSCTCTSFPVGDGGDGTAALLSQQPGKQDHSGRSAGSARKKKSIHLLV